MSMCENPNHEQCEKCSGCVSCGCLCHRIPEGQEEPETPLTLESMGLTAFRDGEARRCPKCNGLAMTVIYHEGIVFSVDGTTPCQEWVEKGLIGGSVGEHLCTRCTLCRYGFPMMTADST